MKRHLLIIAICVLLGAVVNVAVAWGIALHRLPTQWLRAPQRLLPDVPRVRLAAGSQAS